MLARGRHDRVTPRLGEYQPAPEAALPLMTHHCEDLDPCAILGRTVCLQPVSKDVEGEFGPPDSERRQCREPECLTLTSLQTLILKLGSASDCDRVPELDGALEIRDLAHVFDDNGNERGMHAGDFRWESAAGLVLGTLSGITNAGTHRPPAFGDCQRCHDPVLEGHLRGTVCRPREPRFAGCSVVGGYRLRIDPASDGIPQQRVTGTFEGLLVCPCRTE
jgi:hypothetical protein